MRPDFNLGLRNGLVDDKHRLAMNQAIWVYMWLIDRQTKSSDLVLGGKPIRYADICVSYPTMSERAYTGHLATLRTTGYITTQRTPRGLIIAIVKPKKWKSDTQDIAHQEKSDTQKSVKKEHSDTQKNVVRSARIRRSNIRETIRNNNNKQHTSEIDQLQDDLLVGELPVLDSDSDPLTSNALKPKSLRRDRPDINGVIFAFENAMGVKLKKMATQRNMAKHLINHYGVDSVLQAVKAVALVRDERYAPQILDLQDLWEKWDKLGAFFRRRQQDQSNKVAVIGGDE